MKNIQECTYKVSPSHDTAIHIQKNKKIVLLHQDEILHYRVSIYNYFYYGFKQSNYDFNVISSGIDKFNPHPVSFPNFEIKIDVLNILRLLKTIKPAIVIFFVNLKNFYLFPVLVWCKAHKIKVIYWGHAIDLENKQAAVKNFFYSLEHRLVDALILYAPHLLQYVNPEWHSKCFFANNTLNLSEIHVPDVNSLEVKKKYNIQTKKNVIYVGRIQKRKGLEFLLNALALINDGSVGLVLVGSNHDCDIDFSGYQNVYQLGPLFKNELAEIMLATEVFCSPKAIGLSIIDAFYYGLPLVTMDVDHGPEIMYFKDQINGFMVPDGDIQAMADKLRILLYDNGIREQMGNAARLEVLENASIEKMCEGFIKAIDYCQNQK